MKQNITEEEALRRCADEYGEIMSSLGELSSDWTMSIPLAKDLIHQIEEAGVITPEAVEELETLAAEGHAPAKMRKMSELVREFERILSEARSAKASAQTSHHSPGVNSKTSGSSSLSPNALAMSVNPALKPYHARTLPDSVMGISEYRRGNMNDRQLGKLFDKRWRGSIEPVIQAAPRITTRQARSYLKGKQVGYFEPSMEHRKVCLGGEDYVAQINNSVSPADLDQLWQI